MSVRIILTSLLSFVGSMTVSGQDVVTQMNDVKGDAAYCYGEGADENPQVAFDCALEELVAELAKKTGKQVKESELRGKVSKLERKRGVQTRVLVYVPIDSYKGASSTSTATTPAVYETTQPATQEVATAVSPPTTVQPPIASATTNQPTLPVQHSSFSSADYAKAVDVVKQMKMVKSTDALKKLLAADMEGGLIKSCGTMANAKDMDNVYWWVFRKGERLQFVTVLSPVKQNGKRVNLENGEEQTLMDFQGTEFGAVWFTLP